eukprot:CAMPEP_0119395246 /NCGR_PEP_ID=MMETSP1334-20130426/132611_1 /TAXON_ID=127549 /ORGANISM="Calcidiscus leptoporus, Strain RCC1130" /LENGTH=45 /DNA_ID= /DNA_START= /DNA_END= /DNA_ORIENTATION=
MTSAAEEDAWEEPVSDAADEDGQGVYSVVDFYPLLLQRKYGDGWE